MTFQLQSEIKRLVGSLRKTARSKPRLRARLAKQKQKGKEKTNSCQFSQVFQKKLCGKSRNSSFLADFFSILQWKWSAEMLTFCWHQRKIFPTSDVLKQTAERECWKLTNGLKKTKLSPIFWETNSPFFHAFNAWSGHVSLTFTQITNPWGPKPHQ